MSKTNTATKSAILGEPFNTASQRLKKMMLFNLLMKYGDNLCYRCRATIETYQELSIDHKVPWRTLEQFWNLENVAWSHVDCNSRFGNNDRRDQ